MNEHTEHPKLPEEMTESKVLGTLDIQKIPVGYGIVDDPESDFFVMTNDTGDVRLFLDSDTRHLSTMEEMEVPFNMEETLALLRGLPRNLKGVISEEDIDGKFSITKSPKGTELLFAVGSGTSPEEPFTIVQRTSQVNTDATVVHLAVAKTAQLRQSPVYLLLNEILYSYVPHGQQIEVSATVRFTPPRPYLEIEKDVLADKSMRLVDIRYYDYVQSSPQSIKSPVEWYKDSGYITLHIAQAQFEHVKKKIASRNKFD